MLFWSELVEGGAALRQQVFLNAGIIARRKNGSKQGSIPIHPHAPKVSLPSPTSQSESFRNQLFCASVDYEPNI
jgi:hypothetical protein